MVTISKCLTKKQLKEFESLPEHLHPHDAFLVPPFPGSICKIFDAKSPIQKHGKLIPFIAYRDGHPVGRICATINHAHNEYYKDKTGFFGFYDFIDDEEVARKLLDAALIELKNHGCDVARGPYNPTSNDECGLLVEGFDSAPMVMMPYNPAFYMDLYEKVGLKRVRDLHAFYISSENIPPEKVGKIVERVKKRSNISVRNIDLKKLDSELKIIQTLYNETLDRNWGFVPISYEDLQYAANDLKAIMDPEMVIIAEKEGEPVGFSMVIPNMNEFMWKAKRFKNPLLRSLSFIWQLKTKYPREARLAVLGVRPEYQASGIAAVFYFELLKRGKSKVVGGELSWVEETNEPMIRSIELLAGKRYKNYRIFEKAL